MRSITHPYVRRVPLTDDGKEVLIRLDAPGHAIGFRPMHGRETYTLSMAKAYAMAKAESGIKTEAPVKISTVKPKRVVKRPVATPKPAMDMQAKLALSIENLVSVLREQKQIA